MADTNKPTPSTFSQEAQIKAANPFKSVFPYIAIAVCAGIAFTVFYTVFGDPSNFEGGEQAAEAYNAWLANPSGEEPPAPTAGHPVNFFGTVFKGGWVIPIGMTITLVILVFFFERLITIARAGGKGNTDVFVKKVRLMLAKGQIDDAARECDKQKGSVANVVKAGLRKYKEMEADPELDKETKKNAIQAELEEATMLELPMLERNLPILATTATLGVLVGLFGTVLGMIRAFSALGEGGAPNAAELSVGISEALVNTAFGIGNSMISVLLYNLFTTAIDKMTYAMDEAGYSIVQTFDVNN